MTEELLHEHETPLEAITQFVEPRRAGAERTVTATPTTWNERFVSRSAWGARAPKSRTKLTSPQGNTIHWEGPKMGLFPHSECAARVRGIQAFHMDSRGWADIAYTSVVCPHGFVFEGRWAGTRTAAQGTNAGNDISYAHCFLGGAGDPWPDEARAAFAELIGVFEYYGSGTKLWPHSYWHSTMCPGDAIRADIADGDLRRKLEPPKPGPPPLQPAIPYDLGVRVTLIKRGYAFDGKHLRKAQGIMKTFFGQEHLVVGGPYDDGFIQAVKNVQGFFGLQVDGDLGPQTWNLLLAAPL